MIRYTCNVICLIVLGAVLYSCSQSEVLMVSTTEKSPWQFVEPSAYDSSTDVVTIEINTDNVMHTIDGFGACFNELGWVALSKLSKEDRGNIFDELFTPGKGVNFTICRMPLGANDFSRDWYSYNETDGDFEMDHFSIENDLETLVPYIKEAQKFNPDLMLWASPWSPPSWMKWNKHYACASSGDWLDEKYQNNLPANRQGKEGTNMFIQEDDFFKSYALYFSKFIDAYKMLGINISMVMPQNEWNSCQVFPSCTWTSSGLAEFIGKYLGPEMKKKNVQLMLGTMERPTEALVDTVLEMAGGFVDGVGFQWAGKGAVAGIHARYPGLKLYQTEQECGDGENDWAHCLHAWELMKHYIKNGANAYMYWNMVLEEGGVSRWGWSQNSLITVNSKNQTYHFNHEYYLLKHVSHFVKPGAELLETEGDFSDMLAFKNPDQSIVVVAHNNTEQEKNMRFKIDSENHQLKLKPGAFISLMVK
jgi:glucosylceramidase